MTSQPLTSSQPRDHDVITTGARLHLSEVHTNSSYGDVDKTTSGLLSSSRTVSGYNVTTSPDMTSSSTVDEKPPSVLSTNYSSERVAVVTVVCVFMILLAVLLVIGVAVLLRYAISLA